MDFQNGLPRSQNRIILSPQDIASARLNNQFAVYGTDPSFTGDNKIVFLEYVAHGGSLVIKDKDSNAVSGTITGTLDLSCAPMRLDGGVVLTGSVLIAKGFFIEK